MLRAYLSPVEVRAVGRREEKIRVLVNDEVCFRLWQERMNRVLCIPDERHEQLVDILIDKVKESDGLGEVMKWILESDEYSLTEKIMLVFLLGALKGVAMNVHIYELRLK